ncbi:MAG: RNA polymerase sigma factor [Oscillospiraceae bacterium]|nr:RNA polymerase sigma factor [Oscillospiraceae bacterium]
MISAALAVLETDEQRNELSEFYEENKSRLYSIAFERLHNRQDAEDAIQETFLGIAAKPDKFFSLSRTEQSFYVSAIVRNVSVDMFNRKNKHQTDNISEDIIYQSEPELLENSLLEKISHDELLGFINNLPVLQRNVLMLTCLSELSISETADVLKISKNAVNQRLYLARKSIRAFIEGKNNE